MATTASFAATPNNNSQTLGTTAATRIDNSADNMTTIFTAGSSGSKVEEIDAESVTSGATGVAPATLAGLIYLFLHDGTNPRLFDTIPVTAVTATTTVAPWRASPKYYTNLWLKSGWTIRASFSVAPTTGTLAVHVFGADL